MSKVTLFPKDFRILNEVTQQIYDLDERISLSHQKAEKELYEAFRNRWEMGRLLFDNESLILEHSQTWAGFADFIGKTPAQISNNLRGYRYLLAEGGESWDEVVEIMQRKSIKPLSTNFERIGKLLAGPTESDDDKSLNQKQLNRLEQLAAEAQEIIDQNRQSAPVVEHAAALVKDIEEFRQFSFSFLPDKAKWKSQRYLEMIRHWGRCEISGKLSDHTDPHHTYVDGINSTFGFKLPDFLTIPVSREIHNKIEAGELEPTNEEILSILVTCMARYITLIDTQDAD
jgi:hypothetical protein